MGMIGVEDPKQAPRALVAGTADRVVNQVNWERVAGAVDEQATLFDHASSGFYRRAGESLRLKLPFHELLQVVLDP
jgi:hypothetical protein